MGPTSPTDFSNKVSDNCAAQFRSRYHFAWMVDFSEESELITTVLAIYLAEYYGKGPADSAAGGAKTKADEAAVYETTIETEYDLYLFLISFTLRFLSQLYFSHPLYTGYCSKRTTKLCTKFTVASSIMSRKELSLHFIVETLLLYRSTNLLL